MRTILIPLTLGCAMVNAQTWYQMPDFPGTARDDAASFVIDFDVYLGTGMETGWGLTTDWWRYNGMSMEWFPVAGLPASARQYGAGFTVDGKGYLFGGYDGANFLNELWMYDPVQDSWTAKASLPAAGRRASVAFSYDQFGYIATGLMTGDVLTNECWRYDPTTDNWQQMAPVPGPARQRAAAFVDMQPVVLGGSAVDDTAFADGYTYNPASNTWTAIAPLPAPRFWHRASEGHVVGGSSSYVLEHNDTWYYDRSSDSWTVYPMPVFPGGPRRGGVAQYVTYLDLSGLYHGLGFGDGQRHKDWWRLDLGIGMAEHAMDQLRIHPNPATDAIMMQLDGHHASLHYQMTDGLGRSVQQGTFRSSMAIPVHDLAPGRYLIQVTGPTLPVRGWFIKAP